MYWFLFLIPLFISILSRQGNYLEKDSIYVPNPKGHWVNKGTDYDEQWEWWEPDSSNLSLYVSVQEDESSYKIIINDKLPKEGLEYVDCNDKREAEIAVSLFIACYTVLRSVTIEDLVGIEINKDMNGGSI